MAGLPRYMIAKRLRTGAVAYYWNPPVADLRAGFTLHREALGSTLAEAAARAEALNAHLDAWRQARGADASLAVRQDRGTLDWLAKVYFASRAFAAVSARVQPDYRREIGLVLDLATRDGGRLGGLHLRQISASAVDKVYERLLVGPRKAHRVRQAGACITRMVRAWDVARRLHPELVPIENPWGGVQRAPGGAKKAAASRAEAYALADALERIGHPHLAIAALVAFEWLQRPENILAGRLTWGDWRPAERPDAVRIEHHKTGAIVWHQLADGSGPFYSDLEARLARLPRLGVPVVLQPVKPRIGQGGRPRKGPVRLYTTRWAQALVRQAREAAGLPAHVTLDACRHGGMTELGDAGLTETQEMAMSGHTTPDAKRRYVKQTEAQRLEAARRRRAWLARGTVERSEAEFQNGGRSAISERAGQRSGK